MIFQPGSRFAGLGDLEKWKVCDKYWLRANFSKLGILKVGGPGLEAWLPWNYFAGNINSIQNLVDYVGGQGLNL